MTITATTQTKALLLPIPDKCTDLYASGWAYADHIVSQGGDLNAETPDGWDEARVNGFFDRLAAERNAVGKQKADSSVGV
ncbi:hypothetical protein IFT48_03270 [Pseudomonas fluorescens]|uniref:hypothetical protein n=1 Tax=Pseudomonas TaxID=286 RepID=UPI0013CEC418|nr:MULTISPECIES: hypothetical protein [Pseudomonas]MBD8088989.1 hypothetical protein [Pseudomonas fluorescens]MBD8615580.1 hypothetical protein [Pseudomonas putida]MBD8681768.1 hypothetical protein [Pseudomonas sp. CFBP 13719]